jgi:hypothetical protein
MARADAVVGAMSIGPGRGSWSPSDGLGVDGFERLCSSVSWVWPAAHSSV